MKIANIFEVASNKPIILVFGRICSGKGTYCAPFVKRGFHHIATSAIVSELSGAATRDELQQTDAFDDAIARELINQIEQHGKVIIDGIRQPQIVDAIVDKFGDKNIEMVWLEVPEATREERFLKRGARKDNQSFADANQGDSKLGVDDIEKKFKPQSTIVDN